MANARRARPDRHGVVRAAMKMKMPRSLQWLAPLITGLSLLLLLGGTLLWFLVLERDARHWVGHTNQVRQAFMDTRVMALNIEVAKRNYVMSGKDADLERFEALAAKLPKKLDELSTLTTDNPGQQGRLAQLRAIVADQMSHNTPAVALRRKGEVKAAMAVIISPEARAKADQRIAVAEAFLAEELVLDRKRQERADFVENGTMLVLFASAIVLLVTTILATWDRRRRLTALESVNAQLGTDNNRRQVVERELALLATHATDAVFRLSLDGRFLYASPSVAEIIGVAPEDLVGRSLFAHLHADDEAAVFTALHRLRIGERDKITISYRASLRRAKEWTWLEASSGVICDDYGMPMEIISSVRNISRRKQLEFELRDARKAAESAATAKSTFLANMSHEIRTPMNGIVGFADLLRTTPLTPDQQRYVGMIADSSDAMTGLLNDILDFSKVEAGQMVLLSEPFDLHETLRACGTLVTPAILKKGLGIDLRLADDLPRMIEGDALRLRQIVLNLLGNAVKFTQDGAVTLRATLFAHDLVIAVEDSGVGIPVERQKAIFDPFVQADAGTAATFGGTGLGLPISAQLAGLMGGKLDLASTPGHGTTITLTIPLRIAQQAEPAKATSAALAPAQQGLRVLVAEDHDVNQLLIQSMLGQLGCIVDIVPDGAQAVERASESFDEDAPYALLFMDLHRPGMDGHAACRELRARGIDGKMLPIVALTANAYADDIEASYAVGMQDHIAKPFKLADLQAALARWAEAPAQSLAEPLAAPLPEPEPEPEAAAPSIKDRYRARKLQTLEKLEEAAQLTALDDSAIAELTELLHKLAGTAGMFGEAVLGDHARALEETLLAGAQADRIRALHDAMPSLRAAA